MQASKIQWTELTWNPVRGCSRVSKGCEHCYAEQLGGRGVETCFKGFVRRHGKGFRWTGKVALMVHKLKEPMDRTRPGIIFVNSMSDLFHPDLPNEDIGLVWVVMGACLPRFRESLYRRRPGEHIFQVLTKRPARMANWIREIWSSRAFRRALQHRLQQHVPGFAEVSEGFLEALPDVLPNVHLGTSVEDQATANDRVPALMLCPASLRFVSYEPALDVVDFGQWVFNHAESTVPQCLDLVIAGGESGPRARPAQLEWFYRVADQARDAGIPFQMKQLGAVLARQLSCDDKKGGDPDEWPDSVQDRLTNGVPFRNVFAREDDSV